MQRCSQITGHVYDHGSKEAVRYHVNILETWRQKKMPKHWESDILFTGSHAPWGLFRSLLPDLPLGSRHPCFSSLQKFSLHSYHTLPHNSAKCGRKEPSEVRRPALAKVPVPERPSLKTIQLRPGTRVSDNSPCVVYRHCLPLNVRTVQCKILCLQSVCSSTKGHLFLPSLSMGAQCRTSRIAAGVMSAHFLVWSTIRCRKMQTKLHGNSITLS